MSRYWDDDPDVYDEGDPMESSEDYRSAVEICETWIAVVNAREARGELCPGDLGERVRCIARLAELTGLPS